MFEDSLVESRTASIPAARWWTTAASVSFQFLVAAIVIAIPLLHPESLPFHVDVPKVSLTLLPKPPEVVPMERATAASDSFATESLQPTTPVQSLLPNRDSAMNEPAPVLSLGGSMSMTSASPIGTVFGDVRHGPPVSVAPSQAPAHPFRVSSGVSQGLLLTPIRPVYPAIAKAARVEGIVIVEAIISRTGSIESLHIVSGPAMLQSAAMDAIRGARYQPYRLNGEPTEVQTTITVDFRLGS